MTKAIRFHETGGPEVLHLEAVEVGDPGPGQARVRHTYIAVNFIDIYFRTGRYPLPLPNGLGSDAVGVVEAVGPGVTDIRPGDRVGYLLGPQGAYAERRVMPADVLIPLPDGVSDRTASTLMMKGLTAQYLFRQVYPLKGGETILYHAAAGGVGLVACQWARALGVTMIGTASSVVSITTGPEVVPLLTSVPRGCRLSSEAISVSLPTESYTTGTPRPSVISRTRAAMSSRPDTIVCVQPFARAISAFSSVLTVPIIVTPSARAHWQATRPTPPAAA